MNESKNAREKLFDNLKSVQADVEGLLLQFSLGKAEAKDKFEEVKSELKESIRRFKEKYSIDEKSKDLRSKLEELELQLALGKAEAGEIYEEQKKKILKAIRELEDEIKNHAKYKEYSESLKNETEKIQIKL